MSHTSRTVYDVTHVTSSLKDIVFQNKKIRKSPGTSPSVFDGNKIQRLFKPFGNFTQRVWRKQNPYVFITLILKHFLKNYILGTSPSVFYGNKIHFLFFCFWELYRACFTETKSIVIHSGQFLILFEIFIFGNFTERVLRKQNPVFSVLVNFKYYFYLCFWSVTEHVWWKQNPY